MQKPTKICTTNQSKITRERKLRSVCVCVCYKCKSNINIFPVIIEVQLVKQVCTYKTLLMCVPVNILYYGPTLTNLLLRSGADQWLKEPHFKDYFYSPVWSQSCIPSEDLVCPCKEALAEKFILGG